MKNIIKTFIVTILAILAIASLVSCSNSDTANDLNNNIEKETEETAKPENEEKETEKTTETVISETTPSIDITATYNYIKYEEIASRKRDVFVADVYFKNLSQEKQRLIRSKVLGLSDEVLYYDMCVTILSNGTAGYDFAIRPIMEYLNEELYLAIENDDAERIAEVVKMRKEFFQNDSIANSQKETESNEPYSTENHDKIIPLD